MKNKWLLLFVVMLGILFLQGQVRPGEYTTEDEVKSINREIEAQGLGWKAAVNPINRLPAAERRLRLGTLKPRFNPNRMPMKMELRTNLPAALDWRAKDGINWLTPVKNQGSCGSCWAFGLLGTVEAMAKIETNRPDIQPDLSEQQILSCSGAGDCDGGWYDEAADYMKGINVTLENCFPYTASDKPCDPCADWHNQGAMIDSYGWVTLEIADETAIKNALQTGPLVVYMDVYSDFYSYDSGVYQPTPSAYVDGGHAPMIVGYDDALNCWICKNSWGDSWGESGYFKIRRGVCEIGIYAVRVSGVSMFKRGDGTI